MRWMFVFVEWEWNEIKTFMEWSATPAAQQTKLHEILFNNFIPFDLSAFASVI